MDADFEGTKRFAVVRKLGAGGAGIVYEARDRDLGVRVALKRLRRLSADAIRRFKSEFRAIEDVEHPNLVGLGELFEEDGAWFFTMELVPGTDLLSFVRPDDTLDEARLRSAFAQLCHALDALHAAGKVHRDVKPTNALVTAEGRVVLLDFGLATDLTSEEEDVVVGTASYMAPEQALGLAVNARADMYSAGVVLYRALTGRLPYDGLPIPGETRVPAPAPASKSEELNALCMDLLSVTPELRPTARETIARLEHGPMPAPARKRRRRFVGRDRELAILREAFDATLGGDSTAILVTGESGLGKSTLVRRFGEMVGAEYGAVVLAGRCWERETVPFKAIDGIIDALARWTARLPRADAAALFPDAAREKTALLGRIFPALRSLGPDAADAPPDDRERRIALFAAARDLFGRLAARLPVVLVVDDLQWADADGIALLHEVLRTPDAPSLLFVATARGDDAIASGRAIRADARVIELAPLDHADARVLALDVLGEEGDRADAIARLIADESRGHPLFVDALAREALGDDDIHDTLSAARGRLVLDDTIARRIDRLDPAAQRLVEAAAIAGAPVRAAVLGDAIGAAPDALPRLVRALQVARLVRTHGEGKARTVEPYHDRIRDAAVGRLDERARKGVHRELAVALENDAADADTLAAHFIAAGEPARAARWIERAAENASRTLAFDRAASLLRSRLALGDLGDPEKRALCIRLGEALTAAGRGNDAATAFLDAKRLSHTGDLELDRRAAEQLLASGHFDRGLAVLGPVLDAAGIRVPSSRAGAAASFALGRARLAARGLSFRERREEQIPPSDLARIEALAATSAALGMVDTIRGADLQTRHILAALDAGEPRRVARALALEAGFSATAGASAHARTERLLGIARSLDGDPLTRAQVAAATGIAAFLEGRWKPAYDACIDAGDILHSRATGPGATFLRVSVNLYLLASLIHRGELAELARRLPPILEDAAQRGDRYALVHLRSSIAAFVELANGDPARARVEAREAIAAWTSPGTHMPHFFDALAQAQIDLYEGSATRAFERADDAFGRLRRALLLRVQFVRVKMLELRARTALAAGRTRVFEADTTALERERTPWATALALLLRASAAQSSFHAAATAFDDAGMALHAAVARSRAGGGPLGVEGVREPKRLVSMLSPSPPRPL